MTTPTGSIGAFYFAPISPNIIADTAVLTITGLQPNITIVNAKSITINLAATVLYIKGIEPDLFKAGDMTVSFNGVPRNGISPLTVDFMATVIFGGSYYNKYKVKEYYWYFDFDNAPTNFSITTTPNTTKIYSGYWGQKFSVKLCVSIEPI